MREPITTWGGFVEHIVLEKMGVKTDASFAIVSLVLGVHTLWSETGFLIWSWKSWAGAQLFAAGAWTMIFSINVLKDGR